MVLDIENSSLFLVGRLGWSVRLVGWFVGLGRMVGRSSENGQMKRDDT